MKLSGKIFLLFVFVVFLITCSRKSYAFQADKRPVPVSFLALGDSYTIGTAVSPDESWPIQLWDSLQAQGFEVDTTAIIAKNGWTTGELLNGIEAQNPDSSYNLVSLLIGVNNQYRGYDIEIYRKEFRELLEQAIAFAGNDTSRVFVVSIPNYGVTPFGQSDRITITKEIKEYNDIGSTISSEYGIPFVNITPVSEKAADDSTLLASDQLHPSGKMYARWIDEILPQIKQIIKE